MCDGSVLGQLFLFLDMRCLLARLAVSHVYLALSLSVFTLEQPKVRRRVGVNKHITDQLSHFFHLADPKKKRKKNQKSKSLRTRGEGARDTDEDGFLGRSKELSGVDGVSRAGALKNRGRVERLGDQVGRLGNDKKMARNFYRGRVSAVCVRRKNKCT